MAQGNSRWWRHAGVKEMEGRKKAIYEPKRRARYTRQIGEGKTLVTASLATPLNAKLEYVPKVITRTFDGGRGWFSLTIFSCVLGPDDAGWWQAHYTP